MTPPPATAPPKKLPINILPLDALRFLSALWVCLYHGAKPPGNRVVPYFDLTWDSILFGGTGVLAFFVISGFCIHYPAVAQERTPLWGSYLTRRYIRVMIPYLAVLPFAYWAGRDYNMLFGNDLAWTILCDLAYYSLYPFLYHAAKRTGWTPLMVGSLIASVIGCWLNIDGRIDIGTAILIPIFLPVWVLGCQLAEMFADRARTDTIRVPGSRHVNIVRAIIIIFTPIMALLTFYKVIYWIYVGVPFGMFVGYWIWLEICFFSTGRTVPLALTWAGSWIYSLYLTHPITQRGLELAMEYHTPQLAELLLSHFFWLCLRFALMIVATFVAAYVFAVLVEWPSHKLARAVSRRLKF